MTRVLIIDDEPLYHKMIGHALAPLGFQIETASDGEEGLRAAMALPPDLIICDVVMPRMTGYEVTRRLRRDNRFAHIPILILTAQTELTEKLEGFEAGADDYMTKPFQPAELLVRVNVLLRRSELVRKVKAVPQTTQAHIVAVHSLRGGTGCSSLAVNIGIGLANLWQLPTLLIDQVLIAGQVALMLNASLKRTWADVARIPPEELDWEVLKSIVYKHESEMNFIAAPTYPSEAELVGEALFTKALDVLRTRFEYIVVDLPHDFSTTTLQVLDAADTILVVFSPELASVRAAVAALDTYRKLGYNDNKIILVLNYTFERKGLPRKNIEKVLRHPIESAIPFAPDLFIDAINLGKPLLFSKPDETLVSVLERLTLRLSKPEHINKANFQLK
jgi:pilus assembly protein CpaE